ncbi:M50 family metallopeptidase [Paenibacillus sp. sptzw28]|uniref:M50 family metallopeptidase n=1 Tax=Paenibacillus sp. sptzw28 TaxID=715179 RepID=UPI001C6EAE30|nr:M50 family metallopeptidase [Paenibacillus sp. sptzw28]QYR19222.1 M50 family metallopeptidase [Paenibacillus sp. sptzw28]
MSMQLVISAVVVAIITQIPILHRYTKLLNTFIHEVGHALFSIISFGGVRKIKLNADTSGYAEVVSTWWGGRVITTFAGYPFASLFPSFMLYLLYRGYGEVVLWILTVMICLCALLWLRDLLSLAWAVPLIAGFILAMKFDVNLEWLLYILMTIILVDSVSSSIIIARLSFCNYRSAGDATHLFELTMIPPQFWGAVFVLISIATVGYTALVIAGLVPDYYSNVVGVVATVYRFIANEVT